MARTRQRHRLERRIVAALEDRRRYHPLGRYAPPQAIPRDAARVIVSRPRRKTRQGSISRALAGIRSQMDAAWPSEKLAFKTPRRVSMCVKRKTRREVIMASGHGGGRHRPPRRNPWSEIEC